MIIHHEHVEVGIFVYQVVQSNKVRVLSYPELEEVDIQNAVNHNNKHPITSNSNNNTNYGNNKNTKRSSNNTGDFEENELLSIDMIQPGTHATFLRLSDQSGWVISDICGEVYMRQLYVETGLFSFYVDNVPTGIIVRRHPMDDTSDLLSIEAGNNLFRLESMQRIYCDAVVQHPQTLVKYYRLQCGGKHAHATPGWVCDRKPATDETQLDKYYLLEASKVKTGLFAYKAVCGAFIRHRPICSDSSKTSSAVLANDIVVVDVVRESPYENGNGPFLRLADGSGWLFEKKLGETAMIPIPVLRGHWVFAVQNDPVGMILRKQPMDCQDKVFQDGVYKTGEFVECDRKITNSSGVNFYRVLGTAGWLFDKRNNVPMLTMLSEDTKTDTIDDDIVITTSWTPDYVRGIVSTVEGTKEMYYQKSGHILTFENIDGIIVKIFCTTRTMCSIFQHSSKGTIKHFRRACTAQDICTTLQMDLVETIISYDKYISTEVTPESDNTKTSTDNNETKSRTALVKEEETLRLRLLVCESEIVAAHNKRRELLALIKPFDNRRAKVAAWIKESTERHRKANELTPMVQLDNTKVHSARDNQRHHHHNSNSNNHRPVGSNLSSQFASSNSSTDDYLDESTTYADDDDTRLSKSIAKLASISSHDGDGGHNITNNSSEKKQVQQQQKTFCCGECYRSFSGKYSRDIHCREVHKLYCEKCEKIYPSFRELEIHRDEENHW